MENLTKKKFLFPNYFKKIGLMLMVLAILIGIIYKMFKPEFLIDNKTYIKLFSFNILLLGLFFVSWSRDKEEDEMTLYIRLNAISFAFSWIILLIIFTPVINLIFDGVPVELTSQQIVLNMLFAYLGVYYFQKKFR